MSSTNSTSDQATPSTVPSDRKIHKVSVEDVSDRLNAMKVDTKKDTAVDDLAAALASKWEPHRTRRSGKKGDTDVQGTS
ncbi:hypothetical protein IG631_12926 [Alternaria alternata]|nr:hypothetical protein IG631_12926 [Alternaria alternata]